MFFFSVGILNSTVIFIGNVKKSSVVHIVCKLENISYKLELALCI